MITRAYDTGAMSLTIELVGDGSANVGLDAVVQWRCRHNVDHQYPIHGEFHVDHRMEGEDLNDLEWAIRGRQDAAERLAWRWGSEVALKRAKDPCEQGEN